MMKNIMTFTMLFILMFFIIGCASTPKSEEIVKKEKKSLTEEKKEKKEDKKEEQKSVEGENKDNDESADVTDKDTEKKEGKTDKKNKNADNYDGLKYIGPAQNKFSEGIGKYFTDGCESAIKLWTEAIEKDKNNNVVAFNIGLCYQRIKKFEESRKWYERSFNLNPEFVKPLYNMVIMSGDKARSEEGYFLQLIDKTQDVVEKNNFIAWLYFQTGKLDLTEKHAKMVLKEDEQNSEAVINLATVYYKKRMYELAESALITAEKWDSENFKLHKLYGFLAYETGDKNKANIHLQKALKINPELAEVRNILAVLAMEIEDYATAKDHLEFALKIAPDFKSAKMNLALALKGLNEFKRSKEILVEMENDKDVDDEMKKSVLFNIAVLYLDSDVDGDKSLKRFDISVEYFNKYLKAVAKNKDFKNVKKLVDGYIKEAGSEKKKLEMLLKRQAQSEKRKKEIEEEHKLFLVNKEKAFDNAMKEDKVEIWEKFLLDYPVIDENDKFGLAAKARLSELRPSSEKNDEKIKSLEDESSDDQKQ
jgi:tetratricopeptide (TPR) repeat protein